MALFFLDRQSKDIERLRALVESLCAQPA